MDRIEERRAAERRTDFGGSANRPNPERTTASRLGSADAEPAAANLREAMPWERPDPRFQELRDQIARMSYPLDYPKPNYAGLINDLERDDMFWRTRDAQWAAEMEQMMRQDQPNLGLATNEELLKELGARFEVHGHSELNFHVAQLIGQCTLRGFLSYRTMEEDCGYRADSNDKGDVGRDFMRRPLHEGCDAADRPRDSEERAMDAHVRRSEATAPRHPAPGVGDSQTWMGSIKVPGTGDTANTTSPPHYAGAYQPWDFVLDTGQNFLQGNATKYIARARRKGAEAQDLQKAIHYVQKLREVGGALRGAFKDEDVERFVAANGLNDREERALRAVLTGNWDAATFVLQELHAEAVKRGSL